MRNDKTMTIKLTRLDVCDLLLATVLTANASGASKWGKLHDKIKSQLDDFDDEMDREDLIRTLKDPEAERPDKVWALKYARIMKTITEDEAIDLACEYL